MVSFNVRIRDAILFYILDSSFLLSSHIGPIRCALLIQTGQICIHFHWKKRNELVSKSLVERQVDEERRTQVAIRDLHVYLMHQV